MTSLHDTDVPVLDSVVRDGNASIIQSTRLGQAVLDELEAMQRDCTHDGMTRVLDGRRLPDAAPISFPSLAAPPRRSSDACSDACEPAPRSVAGANTATPDRQVPPPELLEQRIDALIDRHLNALRRDVAALLSAR